MDQISCRNCGTLLTPQQAGQPCPKCSSMERLNVNDQFVIDEKAKVAKELAAKHYQFEPAIIEIRTLTSGMPCESRPNEPIKLLEVNADTIASGILPLRFDAIPTSGIPYPSVIVEVTPWEYEKIKTNEMKLPNGWSLGPVLPKP